MRIGFVGLGNIGGAIAANLIEDGHEVTVLDLDPAKVAPHVEAGATAADGVGSLARGSEVTFLSLPTPAAMEQVTNEWLAAAEPGSVLVDLTTNAPATIRALGGRVVASGREFLECPLTGGAPGARMRMLVFICGGDVATYERVGPLLDTIGRARFHLGPLGCGNVGQAREQPDGVHRDVGVARGARGRRPPRHRPARPRRHDADGRRDELLHRAHGRGINERGRPAEFALELAAKDAGLLLDVARDVAVPAPVAGDIAQVLVLAKSMGLGDHDFTDLVEVMERLADVKLELST